MTEEESINEEAYRREHRRRIIEGLRKSTKRVGRPRKEINEKIVITRLNQGVSLTEIAAGQHMSVKTLKKRMKEAGITTKYERRGDKE